MNRVRQRIIIAGLLFRAGFSLQYVAIHGLDPSSLHGTQGNLNGGEPFRSPDIVPSVLVQKRRSPQYRLRNVTPLFQADLAGPTEMNAHQHARVRILARRIECAGI